MKKFNANYDDYVVDQYGKEYFVFEPHFGASKIMLIDVDGDVREITNGLRLKLIEDESRKVKFRRDLAAKCLPRMFIEHMFRPWTADGWTSITATPEVSFVRNNIREFQYLDIGHSIYVEFVGKNMGGYLTKFIYKCHLDDIHSESWSTDMKDFTGEDELTKLRSEVKRLRNILSSIVVSATV